MVPMNSTPDVLAFLSGPRREPSATVLTVQLADQVDYQADICDQAQFAAQNRRSARRNTPKNFFVVSSNCGYRGGWEAEIAMKGTYVGRTQPKKASPQPAPGRCNQGRETLFF